MSLFAKLEQFIQKAKPQNFTSQYLADFTLCMDNLIALSKDAYEMKEELADLRTTLENAIKRIEKLEPKKKRKYTKKLKEVEDGAIASVLVPKDFIVTEEFINNMIKNTYSNEEKAKLENRKRMFDQFCKDLDAVKLD